MIKDGKEVEKRMGNLLHYFWW